MTSDDVDEMKKHENFIRRAIELSISAVDHGNGPFGACLVSQDGQILLTAENTTLVPNRDVTRHAELNLISMACQKIDKETLKTCTLYTSCEPCLMCTGAFIWSGIRRLVFSVTNTSLGECAGFDYLRSCRSFLPEPEFTVIGPICEEEGICIHKKFWPTFQR